METNYNPDHKAVVEEIVLVLPGVKGGKAFGYPAYKINGKVFAFVGGDGIAIKLPAERVQALIAANEVMHPFEPVDGTVWKEWVSIDRAESDDYHQDAALIEESMQYVLSLT